MGFRFDPDVLTMSKLLQIVDTAACLLDRRPAGTFLFSLRVWGVLTQCSTPSVGIFFLVSAFNIAAVRSSATKGIARNSFWNKHKISKMEIHRVAAHHSDMFYAVIWSLVQAN